MRETGSVGVGVLTATASRLQLPPGPWATLIDGLCAHFSRVERAQWAERFDAGRVLDADGRRLDAAMPYRSGMTVQYFREVAQELHVPFMEKVVHADAHLLVVDKPHFLAVAPAGKFVEETLLRRLMRRLGLRDLVPLHRLDRATAGLVLFSVDPATRDAYQSLFRERRIRKGYEAVAAPLPQIAAFPHQRHTRLDAGDPFFRMREIDGEPNALTQIDVLARGSTWWRYSLEPVTGRKHQLRVHMAALGAPIRHDDFYPLLAENAGDDWQRPLQLVARRLEFVDPVSGEPRRFESGMALLPLD
ncbi:MAG: pseudouridine synthase [Tahibacter sp.]